MFDTSLVRSRTVDAPRRVGLFTVSVAIHTAVALGAVAMSIATVDFPAQSPDQLEIFRPVAAVSVPPALGDGEPPRPVRREQPSAPAEPAEVTAPMEVPLEPPVPETPGTGADPIENRGNGEAGSGNGTGGHPLGEPGGLGDGTPGEIGIPDAGPRVPAGEVRAARVLRRVEPRYPSAFVAARKTAVVTVRCVIDRNGRIRDPEVIASSWAPFNEAVIDAVRQWTFAPGTMRGEPVDTWFELTVRFEVR